MSRGDYTTPVTLKSAHLKFPDTFPLSGIIFSSSYLISLTTNGPTMKDTATPIDPQRAATAVEVVRCSDGNQVDDRSVGAA